MSRAGTGLDTLTPTNEGESWRQSVSRTRSRSCGTPALSAKTTDVYYLRMNASMHPDDAELVEQAVEVFRLLADETRVRLLCLLLDAELTVGELAERLDRPAPGISQHLARLRRGRVVGTRRDGLHVHYSIADGHVAQMVIDALRYAEHGQSARPRHHQFDDSNTSQTQREVSR